jgi:hypothetical protein
MMEYGLSLGSFSRSHFLTTTASSARRRRAERSPRGKDEKDARQKVVPGLVVEDWAVDWIL